MSYHHLGYFDRCEIQFFRNKARMSIRDIAKEIGRSPSTVSRELRRNSGFRGRYDALQAQVRASARQQLGNRSKCLDYPPLRAFVVEQLRQKWSPEQISGRLQQLYPTDEQMRVSYETIYQFVYADKTSGGDLYKHLRQAHRKRRRRTGKRGLRGTIRNRVSIEERPAIVERKERCGDWEGDTVFGKGHTHPIATFTERKTQFLTGATMPDKKATSLNDAAQRAFANIPDAPIHTLAVDNGKEFAAHEELAGTLKTDIYFARPYTATDRGLNESINGLLRQYLPKGACFKNLTDKHLNRIIDKLNNRPRKKLGYRTPKEAFFNLTVALKT